MNSIPPALQNLNTLEIKKTRRLKGRLELPGDHFLGLHTLAVSALAEGETRVENLPDSPWFRETLLQFQHLGYTHGDVEGHLLLEGGRNPKNLADALVPNHEVLLFALAGIFSARECLTPLRCEPQYISHQAWQTLELLFQVSLIHSEPVAPEGNATPISDEELSAMEREPDPPRIIRIFQIKGLQPLWNRKRKGMDEHLLKTGLLYHHLASGMPLDLELGMAGPDHLERMIQLFEVDLQVRKGEEQELDELARRMARLKKGSGKQENRTSLHLPASPQVQPQFLRLCSDTTWASIGALAATLVPGSDIVMENVLLNTSRTGFFTALRRMGADIEVSQRKEKFNEPFATVRVRSSNLMGRRFAMEQLQGMREEVPILIIAAACAEGETIIRDIGYLRTYHIDVLKKMIHALKKAGVEIGEVEDGLVIRGRDEFDGGEYDCLGNPILGFAYMVLGMRSHGSSMLTGRQSMEYRFPGLADKILQAAET